MCEPGEICHIDLDKEETFEVHEHVLMFLDGPLGGRVLRFSKADLDKED